MLNTTDKKIEDTIENGAPDQVQNITQNAPELINQTTATDKLVEEAIESNPTAAEQVAENVSGENSPIETEAEQLNDSSPNNDEVNDEAIKQTPIKEKLEILDELRNAGSSFINVPTSPKDDISLDSESIDTNIGVAEEGAGDFTDPVNLSPLDNSQLPALNLQDYHKDLALDGERDLDTTDGEKDLVEDVDYTVVEDSDYVPPTYTIEDLDREIEETRQLPVTNAEEAKEKQNKLKKLKARRVAYGGTSSSDTNWDYDKSTATGGKVSPQAGIGSIGGAAGHGSMTSTKSTKISDNHNSIASKAPLPNALEDNQGKVVSVNGKATTAPSSNNNGAFRSGSFGLMSKAKSNLKSIKSKAPVSGGSKHMGNPMAGVKGMPEVNLEDGKQLLIERLKQLLAQLTEEEMETLGVSSNQWNGKAFTDLDGYTLQDLIDKVEEYLGGK